MMTRTLTTRISWVEREAPLESFHVVTKGFPGDFNPGASRINPRAMEILRGPD